MPAISFKRGGESKTFSYEQYHEESINFARALLAVGLAEFASVCIIGFNAPEWVFSWNGAALARCIPVGVYSTNNQ